MDFFGKIKSILTEPSTFFTNLKKEKTLGEAFAFYAIVSAFTAVMGIIMFLAFGNWSTVLLAKMFNLPTTALSPMTNPLMKGLSVFFMILGYGIGLGVVFLAAGILHIWILIFGGKEGYAKSFQLYVYSKTPSFLFGWIPFVSFFTSIYTLVLLILGTQRTQGFSMKKSVLMYLIPFLILLALIAIGLAAMFFVFSRLPLTGLVPPQ